MDSPRQFRDNRSAESPGDLSILRFYMVDSCLPHGCRNGCRLVEFASTASEADLLAWEQTPPRQ